jgi:regulator of sigma E protease
MFILLFLLTLTVLVFVHELGHFLMAKLFGIRVDEFAIGFPPKIFSKTVGETKYAINLIPFGGYVKIWGEDPEEGVVLSEQEQKRNLSFAPKWKQAVILLSGILFNIIFAWIFISISLNLGLISTKAENSPLDIKDTKVMIVSVLKGSPAEISGLKVGDTIINIDSKKADSISLIQQEISSLDKVSLSYERDGKNYNVEVVGKEGLVENKKAIGISMEMVGVAKYGFFKSFWVGAKLTVLETKNTAIGLKDFLAKVFSFEKNVLSGVSGPVGLAKMSGEAMKFGVSYFFGFVAMISINLALINLIPFPALDGGRVFLLAIEALFRRKIKPIVFNLLNGVGFILLMALMVAITIKDIWFSAN